MALSPAVQPWTNHLILEKSMICRRGTLTNFTCRDVRKKQTPSGHLLEHSIEFSPCWNTVGSH